MLCQVVSVVKNTAVKTVPVISNWAVSPTHLYHQHWLITGLFTQNLLNTFLTPYSLTGYFCTCSGRLQGHWRAELPLGPFPLPAPVPEGAEPYLESSDQATRCTNTAADCAPLPHTDTDRQSGIKYRCNHIAHVHETDTLRVISDQPVALRAYPNCYLGVSCYDNNECRARQQKKRVIKKSLHSLLPPRLYCNIIKSISYLYYPSVSLTIIINTTDKQHKQQAFNLNKQQAFSTVI